MEQMRQKRLMPVVVIDDAALAVPLAERFFDVDQLDVELPHPTR